MVGFLGGYFPSTFRYNFANNRMQPMNEDKLQTTARAMVAAGKGILAMDESHPTCKKRFDQIVSRPTPTAAGSTARRW